jgi:redox-sensing transcriptional repressor
MSKYVSEAVIRRLPKYYRKLLELDERGVERISSQELSEEMGLNASQIRRDFNCFGGFGQQGYGYQVEKLRDELRRILGLDGQYRCAIVGAGNIGRALVLYKGFGGKSFTMDAIFDVNPELIGKNIEGMTVRSMFEFDEFIRERGINLGIICTPGSTAQDVCDKFAALGVNAVWNFAPVEIEGPQSMAIENVHLTDSLYTLTYRAAEQRGE